jgi:hypothetical protein
MVKTILAAQQCKTLTLDNTKKNAESPIRLVVRSPLKKIWKNKNK